MWSQLLTVFESLANQLGRSNRKAFFALSAATALVAISAYAAITMSEQNETMYSRMKQLDVASDAQIAQLRAIIGNSNSMGQGKPDITVHPVTTEQCLDQAQQNRISFTNPKWEKICGAKYMAPIYDHNRGQTEETAEVCMDLFEFPNMPCDYPMTWTKTKDAILICEAMGKRLCDAHEWEGACSGDFHTGTYKEIPEYPNPHNRYAMANAVNAKRDHVWAYTWKVGPGLHTEACSTASPQSKGCNASQANICGSNMYPSGWSLNCVSQYGIYDQHGNAAEAMNLPMSEEQMGRNSVTRKGDPNRYGQMELKGSWFAFTRQGTIAGNTAANEAPLRWRTHEDDCHWRAPNWHGSSNPDGSGQIIGAFSDRSHANYHLGFRCCKDTK